MHAEAVLKLGSEVQPLPVGDGTQGTGLAGGGTATIGPALAVAIGAAVALAVRSTVAGGRVAVAGTAGRTIGLLLAGQLVLNSLAARGERVLTR